MTPAEYHAGRLALSMTHKEVAYTLGISMRTSMRYAHGDAPIATSTARLLRLLVLLRLTIEPEKYRRIIEQLPCDHI